VRVCGWGWGGGGGTPLTHSHLVAPVDFRDVLSPPLNFALRYHFSCVGTLLASVCAHQMVPTVLFIPRNDHLPIVETVKHLGSALFALVQLDISGQSGAAFQVSGMPPLLPRHDYSISRISHTHSRDFFVSTLPVCVAPPPSEADHNVQRYSVATLCTPQAPSSCVW
jgi:hypothetical protein